VTRAGGVLTGSALLNAPTLSAVGLRTAPVRAVGRFSGLLGPSASREELQAWLAEAGFAEVTVEMSGAMGYFRGVRA
jgi:hypothetical protein